MRVLKIIHQDYEPDDVIPPHWVVQYIEDGKGSVDYYYAEDYEDAVKFCEDNGGIYAL